MNFEKVTEAMEACEVMIIGAQPRYKHPADKQAIENLSHCLDMIRRFREWGPERIEKAFRWLGFIQGVMYANCVADIETLKNMNRPDKGTVSERV